MVCLIIRILVTVPSFLKQMLAPIALLATVRSILYLLWNICMYTPIYIYLSCSIRESVLSWQELPVDQPHSLVQQHISCHLIIYSHPALWACLYSFPKVVVAGGEALTFRPRCLRAWPFLQRSETAEAFQGRKSLGDSRLLRPPPHWRPSAELQTKLEQRSVN